MTRRNLGPIAWCGLAVLSVMIAAPAMAKPLDNLERERARLIALYLDPAPPSETRQARARALRRRLVDLERMVLRDDTVAASPSAAARRAFARYDLTFLVHAAAEKRFTVMELWLGEIGVSTATVMSARVGRR